MLNLKIIINKNFCTVVPFIKLYGYELRDKFAMICKFELSNKILNQTERGAMLERKNMIAITNVGKTYTVYNGMSKIKILIQANMVGFKVGEFIFSKKVQNLNVKNSSKGRKFFQPRILKPKIILNSFQKTLVTDQIDLLKYHEQKNIKSDL